MINRTVRNRPIAVMIVPFYFLCILVIGSILVFFVTPMSGLDESYHYKRALEISEGHPFARMLGPNQWGARLDAPEIAFEHWFDLLRNAGAPTSRQGSMQAQARAEAMPPAREMHWFPSTASYPPLPYIPSALGLWMGRLLHMHYLNRLDLGRLANLAGWICIVACIVRTLPAGRLVVLALLTTPTMLHLASCFNADPLSNALPILFAACCLRLRLDRDCSFSRPMALGLFLLGLSLGLLKLTCSVASSAVLLVPLTRFSSPRSGWLFRIVLVTGCAALALCWNATYPFVPGLAWHPGSDHAAMLHHLEHAPIQTASIFAATIMSGLHWWWTDAFSRFGGGLAPYFFKIEGFVPPLGGALAAMLVIAEPHRQRDLRAAAILFSIALSYAALVLLAFYIGFSAPDDSMIAGLQGRYFILPTMLMALGSSLLLPRHRWPDWVGHGLLVVYLFLVIDVSSKAIIRYGVLWN